MQYRPLGRTDLAVSQICLGSMTWGEQNSEAEAHAQLDAACDMGVNFIDTAEIYPVPSRGETQGRTEKYIGSWLTKRKNRDRIVLASKVAPRGVSHLRSGKNRLDRANIRKALTDSLHRLRTDYLDLYQVHWPERAANYFGRLGYEKHQPTEDGVPIDETLEALAELVKEGKVRHVGISNETPWGTIEYLRLSDRRGWPRVVSIQNPYNLLNRSFEIGLAEIACREDVGLLAYSPLAFGVLSGKYLNGAQPKKARLTLYAYFTRYRKPRCEEAVRDYAALARRHGWDPAQMALAFVNSRPFLTSNIIGATNLKQLHDNVASAELSLDEALLEGIQRIHEANPNPAP